MFPVRSSRGHLAASLAGLLLAGLLPGTVLGASLTTVNLVRDAHVHVSTFSLDLTADAVDAVDDTLSSQEDPLTNPVPVDVLANDTYPPGSTITSVTQGTIGDVTIATDGLSVFYAPHQDANGSDAFTYTLDDGSGSTDTATVNVTISPVNDAPIADDDSLTVSRNAPATAVDVLANDTDVEGDPLTITGKSDGSQGTVVITGGGTGLTYQPNADATAGDSFTYTISDGQGGVGSATVSVTINDTNTAPDAVDDSVTVAEDAAATDVPVLGNDTDGDGDPLTITGKTDGGKGAVVITGGGTGLTYQPNPNATGGDSFTYTISDGHGGAATGTVSVTITPNHAPNAVNDAGLTVPESAGATSVPVGANDTDADGDTLRITATTNGAHGTVAITGDGSGLTYDPVQLYVGTDVFTYTISDGRGGSDTAAVLLTVVRDTTRPVVSAPAESFYSQTVASSTMRAHIAWSGSDGGSGIARYQLQVSVNGGAYGTISLSSGTATAVNRTITNGRSYRYRVRAFDREGNASAYRYGPTFRPARFQDSSSAIVYSGSWTTSKTSRALGGSHRFASSLSARASLTRAFRDVAIVATKTPGSGSAQVWIDGVFRATINLRASSTSYRKLVYRLHFSTLVTHTVEIRPIGGGRVYLDAFLLYR